MKTPALIAIAAATLTLAACNQNSEPEVVDTRAPDPLASQIANAAPVELPPAVKATVTFRCQPGNTLLYVEFFSGDKLAVLKTVKDGTPTALRAPEAGQPFVAEGGYSLTGGPKSATIVAPGVGTKTCKA
jgi:hypothetical protein